MCLSVRKGLWAGLLPGSPISRYLVRRVWREISKSSVLMSTDLCVFLLFSKDSSFHSRVGLPWMSTTWLPIEGAPVAQSLGALLDCPRMSSQDGTNECR